VQRSAFDALLPPFARIKANNPPEQAPAGRELVHVKKSILFYLAAPALAAIFLLPAGPAHSVFGEVESEGLLLEVRERLSSDLTDPPVQFVVRNDYSRDDVFSGRGEDRLKEAGAWQIQIYDQSGRKVSYLQGKERLSGTPLPWAGTTVGGEQLSDGFYKARLVWVDGSRRVRTTPAASLSLVTPLEIRELFDKNLRLSYTAEGLALTFTESMLFAPGNSRIKVEAFPALQQMSRFLKTYPQNMVSVRGYTDSSGGMRQNLALSRQRAAHVCGYLVKEGLPAERLTYSGFGPARPIASNATAAGRARNRRVEVVVLKTAS
jgi:outer membrane protein OmpA-like peptidoglycan-associated protein